jgi:hypothetical protein
MDFYYHLKLVVPSFSLDKDKSSFSNKQMFLQIFFIFLLIKLF